MLDPLTVHAQPGAAKLECHGRMGSLGPNPHPKSDDTRLKKVQLQHFVGQVSRVSGIVEHSAPVVVLPSAQHRTGAPLLSSNNAFVGLLQWAFVTAWQLRYQGIAGFGTCIFRAFRMLTLGGSLLTLVIPLVAHPWAGCVRFCGGVLRILRVFSERLQTSPVQNFPSMTTVGCN